MTRQRWTSRAWGWAGLGLLLGTVAHAALPASAQGSSGLYEGNPRVHAALLVDASEVKPGGTFRVGVRFRMEPGWHIYWKNPGDAGLATEMSWDTPGVTVGALQWPWPHTFRTSDGFITTHGYQDETLFFASAHVSEAASGQVMLSAAADALVCDINCIPAQFMLTRSVPVGAETRLDAEAVAAFDAAQAQVPRTAADARHTVSLALDAPSLTPGKPFTGTLTVAAKDGKPVPGVEGDFFVHEVIPGVTRVALKPQGPGRFHVEGEASPDAPAEAPRLKGVLRLGSAKTGYEAFEVDVPMAPVAVAAGAGQAAAAGTEKPSLKAAAGAVQAAHVGSASDKGAAPAAQVKAPVSPSTEPVGLGLALLFAFLGGALLNLMPCVFPVLALKAYGFTRMVREEKGQVAPHAAAYAGGILATMLVLAGAVLVVRAGGRSVGWGFQFQEPLFVAAVSGVLVAFALNLFGVFNVGTDGTALAGKVDASQGLLRSAGEGVLAVVLATPCSAPLLGTAVGFAFAAGAGTVLAVFAALGLGLALPFCALVLVPGLAKRLPKPGAWMERGKQLLGFALLATTVWLVWVMGGLAGVDGMARLLAFLVAVGLGAWLYGQAQASEGGRKWLGVGAALAVLLVAGGFTLRFQEAAPSAHNSTVAGVQPWDEAAVASALQAGQPVFIDFTADWCLTCKFNERTVLSREDVRAAFTKHNVAVFVADWTRRDARIREKLGAHGKAGVPMYLVLSPSAPDAPVVLPELLTVDLVVDAVARAADGRLADAR